MKPKFVFCEHMKKYPVTASGVDTERFNWETMDRTSDFKVMKAKQNDVCTN